MGVTHFAFDFRLRNKRRNRVNYHNIQSTASYKSFGNFERLLACIGLGYYKIVYIYSEILRIDRV